MSDLKVLFSSKSDEWETPQDVFNALHSEFHFTLDACATEQNHKCERFFTLSQDGLLQDWGGALCFAIHRIQTLPSGLKKRSEKAGKTTRLLSCLYHPERTQSISMILFINVLKYDLSVEG